ncbi:electron transport complex subunit G [Sulfurimicrobium lacus]|uniref:Ion-translocating oxidoreductase complex subunit G n=1 Tax=Sulfurimicrobium lacus TaxID=2715678 RepID=A0A6F8VD86_9PROT|nr:electron transport complex subunit RsxG [Sulfurimicrobium lacus]BCB26922.1 electron transport complex subunit G [Sulfurimicrobium lacus]
MSSDYVRHSTKLAMVLAAFALVGTSLLALTFDATKDIIAASEKKAKLALIAQILPPELYDNDIISDAVNLPPQPELGTAEATVTYRALKDGKPSAVVLEAVAPDGYAGKIKLLIAIKADGVISGVRVVSHKETPGLGDYIEIAKSNWIKGFDGTSLEKYQSKDWKVKKDGGQFDSVAGATITPRAVVKAVYKALGYFSANREKIFTLPKEQAK